MNDPIKLAIEALEAACGNRCNAEYNPCQAREAIAALRARPKSFSDELREVAKRGKPDHSELIAKLRLVAKYHRSDRQASDDAVILEAANALEGK